MYSISRPAWISCAVLLALIPLLPARAQSCAPAELLAPSGAANDNFGSSAAISTDTVVFGAPGKTVGANSFQGQAFVYRWNGSAWLYEATLTAADGAPSDSFGCSVAISGNTVVIGAYAKTIAGNTYQGAAYVFTRSGTTWTQQAKLVASDGAAGDEFGYSVSIDGSTIVSGAYAKAGASGAYQGAAYVFTLSGASWSQQAKLLASDGATNDFFGISVGVSGNAALIGAAGKTSGANIAQGAAYIFSRSGAAWTQQSKLLAGDGADDDYFGVSVSISGSAAICGAVYKTVGANPYQGAAYIFATSGAAWTQQAKLVASDGQAFDYFGAAVALSGTTAVIGADIQDVGVNVDQGSAYLFTGSGANWVQEGKLVAPDGAPGDFFGSGVAASAAGAVVGAPDKAIGAAKQQGAGYIFGTNIPISLTQQPMTTSTCSQRAAVLTVSALGTGPFNYLWQWRASVNSPTWLSISDGSNTSGAKSFTASNSKTPSLNVSKYRDSGAGDPFADFQCIVTSACGSATSNDALIHVCWADLNCDGLVDDSDFVLFATAYNLLSCSSPAMPPGCPADLNGDGQVDDLDFAIFATAYNLLKCP